MQKLFTYKYSVELFSCTTPGAGQYRNYARCVYSDGEKRYD